MKNYSNQLAKTYTALETFSSESERNERMVELATHERDIKFTTKVAFDLEDCYILEYTIVLNKV